MKALEFYKTIVKDSSNFLDRLIGLLEAHGIRYCVIGGQAVNAYVEPLVTLDLDIVIAVDQLACARSLFEREFHVREFPHSLNLSLIGSDLRVQIQTDPAVFDYVERATRRHVLGLEMPVAALEDLLAAKIGAALEPARRPSKRRKDVLDIERLIEAYPDLRSRVPARILAQLDRPPVEE